MYKNERKTVTKRDGNKKQDGEKQKNIGRATGLGVNVLPKRKLLKACHLPGLWVH